jgi:glyoxylase-like metal-dependent hydrolase (beta-lactamase superfamily II)
VKIEQLLLGNVSLPPQHPRAGDDYPIYGYLIRHPSGLVLVDTGVGPGHRQLDELFRPDDVPLEDALASAGATIGDVAMVINTHLHFDHVGRNARFPGIPMAAQVAERRAAQEPGYTVREWIEFPGADWQLVDGRAEILPGIEVLPTRSHTPGHQAVVVTAADSVEVIAGQALQNRDEFEAGESLEDLPRTGPDSFESVARSIKELHPAAVWFSHDIAPWRPAQEVGPGNR